MKIYRPIPPPVPTLLSNSSRKKRHPTKSSAMAILLTVALFANMLLPANINAQETTPSSGTHLYLPFVNSGGTSGGSTVETGPGNPVPTEDVRNLLVGVQQVEDQHYLVTGGQSDAPGMALYTFADDDEGGPSRCNEFCAIAWPPFTVRSAEALHGASIIDASLGTVQRADGTLHVTYEGWPLYRYVGDSGPAMANGEGISGVWSRAELALDASAEAQGDLPTQRVFTAPNAQVLTSFAEAGSLRVNQLDRSGWHTVQLQQGYAQPVIIMQPLSHNGGDPATIRIQNITHQSFQFQMDEWAYLNGMHTTETIFYMVVEEGVHTLAGTGGQQLVAGIADVDHTFTTIPFNNLFSEPPVVLSQVQSRNDAEQVITRQRHITELDFELRLQEAEASDGVHPTEAVSYIAMMPGHFYLSGRTLEVGHTLDAVTHLEHEIIFDSVYMRPPLFLAAMQTFDGADPATLRYTELITDSAKVFVQEERSLNKEVMHTTETVGYITIGRVVGDPPTATPTPTVTITPTPTPIIPPNRPTVMFFGAEVVYEVFESSRRGAIIEIQRFGSQQPLNVPYELLGANDPTKGSATVEDFAIVNSRGRRLNGHIPFAEGQMREKITIRAIADEQIEVPEMLRLQIHPERVAHGIYPGADEITVILRDDKAGITTDSRIVVAQMVAQTGAQTGASGLAIVRLSNDNSYGEVSVNHSGLTSVATAAHIHYLSPSGPIVFSIDGTDADMVEEDAAIGQIMDARWEINAAHGETTDQAMFDKLLGGQLYVNVHSEDYNGGEISGALRQIEGSTTLVVPPTPEPLEILTGDALKRDISRFLTQATFGPNVESVADMEARVAQHGGDRIAAYTEWIDEQMAMNAPSLLTFGEAMMRLHAETNDGNMNGMTIRPQIGFSPGWFTAAVYGEAELRERVAFSLSEIFVISQNIGTFRNRHWGVSSYYDMLKANAFGSYEQLLTDVSKHPSMGTYLSHMKNRATWTDAQGNVIASPDENYAREIMQLFSIGLLELHLDGSLKLGEEGLPIRTYTQDDITNLSRIFTGWSYGRRPDHNNWADADGIVNNIFGYNDPRPVNKQFYRPNRTSPMKMFEDNGHVPSHANYVRYHDNSEKNWLGGLFPAGQPGEQELGQVMSTLSSHPNTSVFISRQLIQRLVTSNPSAGYIYRVATIFEETNGNLGAVIKAILLDPEARNLSMTAQIGYGKVREPLLQMVGLFRLVGAASKVATDFNIALLESDFGYPASEVALLDADAEIALFTGTMEPYGNAYDQSPLNSPTVFNFFRPDYAPNGDISDAGLVAPELQLMDETNAIGFYNAVHRFVLQHRGIVGIKVQHDDPGFAETRLETLPEWMFDAYMDVMDTDSNGFITAADTAFTDPVAVRTASAALVDGLDDYLCTGRLKANATGNPQTDPREILIDGVVDTWRHYDQKTADKAQSARDARIREALYLVTSAPQCVFTD